MSFVHLKRLKKLQRSNLAFFPYRVQDHIATYASPIEQRILETLLKAAKTRVPPERIRAWTH